jgi:hypothetical protein
MVVFLVVSCRLRAARAGGRRRDWRNRRNVSALCLRTSRDCSLSPWRKVGHLRPSWECSERDRFRRVVIPANVSGRFDCRRRAGLRNRVIGTRPGRALVTSVCSVRRSGDYRRECCRRAHETDAAKDAGGGSSCTIGKHGSSLPLCSDPCQLLWRVAILSSTSLFPHSLPSSHNTGDRSTFAEAQDRGESWIDGVCAPGSAIPK